MEKTVGPADRVIRIILGILFLIIFFLVSSAALKIIFAVLGIVGVITGATGSCPFYNLLRIKTIKPKEQ
jgi:hypothetical protein